MRMMVVICGHECGDDEVEDEEDDDDDEDDDNDNHDDGISWKIWKLVAKDKSSQWEWTNVLLERA